MQPLTQALKISSQRRSNFGTKARRFKNMLSDKKLLTRAHQELCLSTHALFLEAYGDDELAHGQYQEWQRGFQATVKNKRISEREERDKIASILLPLQVKAYVIVRLAERYNVH